MVIIIPVAWLFEQSKGPITKIVILSLWLMWTAVIRVRQNSKLNMNVATSLQRYIACTQALKGPVVHRYAHSYWHKYISEWMHLTSVWNVCKKSYTWNINYIFDEHFQSTYIGFNNISSMWISTHIQCRAWAGSTPFSCIMHFQYSLNQWYWLNENCQKVNHACLIWPSCYNYRA